MKVTEEVWQVGGGSLTDPEDAAVYLIGFDEQAALIDAGTGKAHERLAANIEKWGVSASQIEYLFLTHCHYDHTGGAQRVREAFGCKIVAHELDAVYLERGDSNVTGARWYGEVLNPVTVDHKITSFEDSFVLGNRTIQSFHTPGHSPGSAVYLVESRGKRILFGQDVHGPLDPSLLSNREDYIKSLKFLLSLKADILCEGHFGIFKGPKDIQAYIRSFL
ncbi:MAG: MBL fold metallo-hydrolase [Deltaproteobacteria bacterium]|nr:MAG: MBL fold metallo-hydrolase [Deltaproteobacteria bacterium]